MAGYRELQKAPMSLTDTARCSDLPAYVDTATMLSYLTSPNLCSVGRPQS